MMSVTVIISSLSLFCVECQEVKLISKLNNFFNFDHNIILTESSSDMNGFIHTASEMVYTPRSVYVYKSIDDTIFGLETVKQIESKNTFTIVVSEVITFESNLSLLMKVREIQRLQLRMKIGIFFLRGISIDDLTKVFEWCWNNRIINIFAAFYLYPEINRQSFTGQLNIFTYNPFGTFHLTNVTNCEEYDNLFLQQNANFHKHPLKFLWLKEHSAQSDVNVWSAVLQMVNASAFHVVEQNSVDPQSFRNDTVDITANIYKLSPQANYYLYPMRMNEVIVMVPEALPYAKFSSYLQAITSYSFFGYSLVIIVGVILILTFFRYKKQKKILFYKSVIDVASLLLNDNSGIKYRRLSITEVFTIVPLTFTGLVIVNGFLSTLQSYLTRPIMQPQIDTLKDIYRCPYPIYTALKDEAIYVADTLNYLSNTGNWSNKIHVIESQQFLRQIGTFDKSKSFVLGRSFANSVIRTQKKLNIKGYHIPRFYVYKFIGSYSVHNAFPFYERINEITHRIQSAGLYTRWRRDDEKRHANFLLQTYKLSKIDEENSDIDRFQLPMFIIYGWCLSIVVFVLEIIWKKIVNRFQRICKNVCH